MGKTKDRMIFRVDANTTIGRGHLSRLSAVASMFEKKHEIHFVVSSENEEFCKGLLTKDWTFSAVKDQSAFIDILDINDILWVDGYHFSSDWRKSVFPKVRKLIMINDLPEPLDYVTAVLNHTPGITKELFRNESIKYFLGLEYAMLRESFLKAAKKRITPELQGQGVFVCFGGADPNDLGYKIVIQLLKNGFEDPIYFVSGKKYHWPESSNNLCQLQFLSEQEMIRYIDKSKICVVPSSVLSIELIALRKPFVTCYYVENQKLVYKGISESMLASCCGIVTATMADVNRVVDKAMSLYDDIQLMEAITKNQIKSLSGDSQLFYNKLIELE